MKKGHVAIIVLVVLAALGLLLHKRDLFAASHLRAVGGAGGDSAAADSLDGRDTRRKRTQPVRSLDPRIEIMKKDPFRIKVAALSGYLESHNRSPQSVVAAYLLSGEKELLDELRKHPDSPEAVLCLAEHARTPEEKQGLFKRYIELNPGDMTGYLLAAASVDGPKNKEEQLDLIKKGIAAETFTCGFGDIGNDLEEAVISTGMTTTEARIYLATNHNTSGGLFATSLGMVALGSQSVISAAESPEDKARAIDGFLAAAESFKEVAHYGGESCEARYNNTVVKLLGTLPGDLILQDKGQVSDYLATLTAEKAEFARNWRTSSELLPKASPEQVDTFFEKRRYEGYKEANRWLMEEIKH